MRRVVWLVECQRSGGWGVYRYCNPSWTRAQARIAAREWQKADGIKYLPRAYVPLHPKPRKKKGARK